MDDYKRVFEAFIFKDIFSEKENATNTVSNWMYMGSDQKYAYFKHGLTRTNIRLIFSNKAEDIEANKKKVIEGNKEAKKLYKKIEKGEK